MQEFLESCEPRIPIKDFNRRGNKRHIDLYRELTGLKGKAREIEIYQHPVTGVARRKAKSAKSIITNDKMKAVLVEVSRTYLNGKTIPNFDIPLHVDHVPLNLFSNSETVGLGEHPFSAAIRGLEEELHVSRRKLVFRRIQETHLVTNDIHPSKAYAGVESEVESHWYVINTYQLSPAIMIPTVRDSGVTINRQWYVEGKPFAIAA
ncbi:MAG: hypothetical protein AB202_00565 [Parcubacteria bacterium C7867-007]|nr:MAG: hypothetical protein AB202_00565 [Parcubacteria bacterium C7867-007]